MDRRGTWINEIIGPFDQQDRNTRSSHASVSSSSSSATGTHFATSSSCYSSANEEKETSEDDEEEVGAHRTQPVPVDEQGRRGKKSAVPGELMKSSFWRSRLAQQEVDDE